MTEHSKIGNTWLTKLERIGELSARNKAIVFNNIGHVLNADMLKILYLELDGKKAVGIDKVTKETYGMKLDENVNELMRKFAVGSISQNRRELRKYQKKMVVQDRLRYLALKISLSN